MADGSLRLALEGAEELFSLSTTLQAAAGKNADGLKAENIFYHRRELPEGAEAGAKLADFGTPFVVLHPGVHGYVQIGQGVQYYLGNTGGVAAEIYALPSGADYKEQYRAFVQLISATMDEVAALVGRDTYWPFNSISLLEEPWRPDVAKRQSEDYWVAVYLLQYTVEQ